MKLLEEAIQELKLDTRMVERNLRNQSVTAQEVDKHISALPDDSANAGSIEIEKLVTWDGKGKLEG